MPKVKKDTITNKKFAAFFNTTTETLRQWKKSDDVRLNRRYDALKIYFIREFDKKNKTILP